MTIGRSDTRRKLVHSTKFQQPVVKSILSIPNFQIVVFAVRWLFDLEIVPKIQLYHMVFRCWNKRKVSLKLRWQNTKNIIEISDLENDNDWTRNNKTLKPSVRVSIKSGIVSALLSKMGFLRQEVLPLNYKLLLRSLDVEIMVRISGSHCGILLLATTVTHCFVLGAGAGFELKLIDWLIMFYICNVRQFSFIFKNMDKRMSETNNINFLDFVSVC